MTTVPVADAREVHLPGYAITIAPGALARAGEIVRAAAPAHRYAVITDENVGPLYAGVVARELGGGAEIFTVPSGELHKTRETWAGLTDAMLAAGFGRDTTVVAVGGGVVGDLAGFVAATYMRGVPIVQVPTTLLAMVDASVGGKVGVDTDAGKNLVGAFHPPAAVVIDPEVLRTLPAEHRRAGFAEILKHGVIADACYFEEAEAAAPGLLDATSPVDARMTSLIARSVEIKADVVRQDEREHGLRKTLNFGHTIGHALEQVTGYAMLHGAAVAVGMIAEASLGERIAVTEPGTSRRIAHAVRAIGLPATVPVGVPARDIVEATRRDKKARGGAVEYALPRRIGVMAGEREDWSMAAGDADVIAALADVMPSEGA
ncbi:MAG TPA: 3-dehydroquinate synthase [Gemmatimonadaceae bacterium]|nr:3-dehydroquinate synthase [Gemmatimonadaceae bacterium]